MYKQSRRSIAGEIPQGDRSNASDKEGGIIASIAPADYIHFQNSGKGNTSAFRHP